MGPAPNGRREPHAQNMYFVCTSWASLLHMEKHLAYSQPRSEPNLPYSKSLRHRGLGIMNSILDKSVVHTKGGTEKRHRIKRKTNTGRIEL